MCVKQKENLSRTALYLTHMLTCQKTCLYDLKDALNDISTVCLSLYPGVL